MNTHEDQEIEDSVPRLDAQTTSRTALRHPNGTSKASRHLASPPVDHPINQDNVEANEVTGDSSPKNNNDSDADEDDEDEDTQVTEPKPRRTRTSNMNIRPSQLRFYSGTWVDVLTAAKNNYRLFIHNEDPFPERTAAGLEDARGCLLDAIGKFKEENQLPLDEGTFIQS